MIAVYIWIVVLSFAIVILMIEDDSNKREMRILREKIDELWEMTMPFPRPSSAITSPIVVYNTNGKSGYIIR